MIETFYGSDALTTSAAFLSAFIIGIAFGWCLEQAGFGSSRRLAGIFYFRDMSVLKVMFSAVITAMLGIGFMYGLGILRPESVYVPETILGAQLAGGLIFGMGFVIAGWCPGTAAVGMVSGKIDALVFLVGALAGSYIFNEAFVYFEPLYSMGDSSVNFVYEWFNTGFAQCALIVTVVGVVAFWFSELIEEKFNYAMVAAKSSGLWIFSVAILIGACGVLLISQNGFKAKLFDRNLHADILHKVEAGTDHIDPETLAREIIERQKSIALVDIRTREEYDEWHIPGAVHLSMSSLPTALERYRNFDRIVLYSNGVVHPAQAWVVLLAAGYKNVCVLADGLQGFFVRVLQPASLRSENLDDKQKLEISAWRAMFLGSGMAVGAAEPVSGASQ